MQKKVLGKTGIEMTEMTLGVLPMGPLQKNIPSEEAKKVILTALDRGINSIDTAETYKMDVPIKEALSEYGGEFILATKSTAATYENMEKSIRHALKSLGRDYLDIFYLHAFQATPQVFEERSGAFRCLLDYRDKGIIRAVGIATHAVGIIEKAAQIRDIDVVFSLINKPGLGIIGGNTSDMIRAIESAAGQGKGVIAMKALGGGNLLKEIKESLAFVRSIKSITSIAIGMVNTAEIDTNIRLFEGEDIPEAELGKLRSQKKLFISQLCSGCGTCVEVCPNQALTVIDGKAEVDCEKCLLCGYCNSSCPKFALRMV